MNTMNKSAMTSTWLSYSRGMQLGNKLFVYPMVLY